MTLAQNMMANHLAAFYGEKAPPWDVLIRAADAVLDVAGRDGAEHRMVELLKQPDGLTFEGKCRLRLDPDNVLVFEAIHDCFIMRCEPHWAEPLDGLAPGEKMES